MEQALNQFAVKILCDDSTGFDEVDTCFWHTSRHRHSAIYSTVYDLD